MTGGLLTTDPGGGAYTCKAAENMSDVSAVVAGKKKHEPDPWHVVAHDLTQLGPIAILVHLHESLR